MAGDRKFGDLAIGFFVFIACFSAFILLITSFDSASNNSDAIGNQMLSSSSIQSLVSNESVVDPTGGQLQSVTFNNNTFQAPQGQFIDTRGVSQAQLVSNNYPSTISGFLKGVQGLFAFRGSSIIFGLLIMIIGVIAIILLLRFFQGSFKI